MAFILLFAVATWAGAQNALAGGGSFLTLPALMFTGMDALAANITSCAALFPAQVATGWTGRKLARGANGLSLRTLFVISIVGGAVGAAVLLGTPRGLFARLVPWLVLFATVVFAWGSFFRKPVETHSHLGTPRAALAQ
ncbi:MAG: TSUP family transporter, partial [Methylocystis sp.]